MGFVDAVKALYRNYAKFDGRASRSEYWWTFLYFIMIYAALLIVPALKMGSLGTLLTLVLSIVVLGTCIPMISVSVRRLHDYNKSGWFYLLGLIPFVSLYLLYLYVQPGTRGPNQYGPDPLEKGPMQAKSYVPSAQALGTPVEGSHTRIFI